MELFKKMDGEMLTNVVLSLFLVDTVYALYLLRDEELSVKLPQIVRIFMLGYLLKKRSFGDTSFSYRFTTFFVVMNAMAFAYALYAEVYNIEDIVSALGLTKSQLLADEIINSIMLLVTLVATYKRIC